MQIMMTLKTKMLNETADNTKNWKVLIFNGLTIVVLCLTLFNLYLFNWVWCKLDEKASLSGRSRVGLVEVWPSIKFKGSISSKGFFQADQINAKNENPIEISSNNSIQLSQLINQHKQNLVKRPLIELISQSNTIKFPLGFYVVDPNNRYKKVLACHTTKEECDIFIKQIILGEYQTSPIDFNSKSLQTNKIETNRLHSQTNKLKILSSNLISFKSLNGPFLLSALDGVTLASRNSAVVFKSKSINLSKIIRSNQLNQIYNQAGKELKQNKIFREPLNSYKLCICLFKETNTTINDDNDRTNEQKETKMNASYNENNGLIFGVRPTLNCFKFSTFCQKSLE